MTEVWRCIHARRVFVRHKRAFGGNDWQARAWKKRLLPQELAGIKILGCHSLLYNLELRSKHPRYSAMCGAPPRCSMTSDHPRLYEHGFAFWQALMLALHVFVVDVSYVKRVIARRTLFDN